MLPFHRAISPEIAYFFGNPLPSHADTSGSARAFPRSA
jgi:hypothetical protein